MKVIIAGSRNFWDYETVCKAINMSGFQISTVVSGAAPGVDTLGERWARENNVEVASFPAMWHTYGRAAGPIRNELMAKYAEALIAIWNGKSPGTKSMLSLAKDHNLQIFKLMI